MSSGGSVRWASGSMILLGLLLAGWWSLTTNLDGIDFFLFPLAAVLLVTGGVLFLLT